MARDALRSRPTSNERVLSTWGLPFLIIGIYVIIGRFFHDAYIRKRTSYAVTNERVIVIRGSKLSSLAIDRLPRLELSQYRDGTGTLEFEANTGLGRASGFNQWTPALSKSVQFLRIPDSQEVYDLIRKQEHR